MPRSGWMAETTWRAAFGSVATERGSFSEVVWPRFAELLRLRREMPGAFRWDPLLDLMDLLFALGNDHSRGTVVTEALGSIYRRVLDGRDDVNWVAAATAGWMAHEPSSVLIPKHMVNLFEWYVAPLVPTFLDGHWFPDGVAELRLHEIAACQCAAKRIEELDKIPKRMKQSARAAGVRAVVELLLTERSELVDVDADSGYGALLKADMEDAESICTALALVARRQCRYRTFASKRNRSLDDPLLPISTELLLIACAVERLRHGRTADPLARSRRVHEWLVTFEGK